MSILEWSIWNLKWAKLKELGAGVFFGLVTAIVAFCLDLSLSYWKDIIKEFPSIAMCAFGFMLTLLGLTLQSNTSTAEALKSDINLFNRYVSFNKRVVYLAFFISIYSYFVSFAPNYITGNNQIERFIISFWLFFAVWFIWDLQYFIRIFYLLVKEKK
jgi:hypothetical protein